MDGSPKKGVGLGASSNGALKDRSGRGEPALDRLAQAQIGDKLRAMYGELTDQPVPDRLTAILARLGSSGAGSNT